MTKPTSSAIKALKSQVRRSGWGTYTVNTRNPEDLKLNLIIIAQEFGEIRVRRRHAVEILRPKSRANAARNSLSAKYGKGLQPWHIDMANHIVPARYIVLACAMPGEIAATTELLDWKSMGFVKRYGRATTRESFIVRSGRNSFYATLLSRTRPFLRHDPGCMYPITPAAAALQNHLCSAEHAPSAEINWDQGMLAVVDNWALLHRRQDARKSIGRTLYRVCVHEKFQ
jgi:hypothetical protein